MTSLSELNLRPWRLLRMGWDWYGGSGSTRTSCDGVSREPCSQNRRWPRYRHPPLPSGTAGSSTASTARVSSLSLEISTRMLGPARSRLLVNHTSSVAGT